MAGRATVPEAARANARLFRAAATNGEDGERQIDAVEARALLELDRQQREDRVGARLSTDEEEALLALCG